MTDSSRARDLADRAARRALSPVTSRLHLLRRRTGLLFAHQDELAAAVEQASSATHRLEAYVDEHRRELDQQLGDLRASTRLTQSLVERAQVVGDPRSTAVDDPGSAIPAGPAPAGPSYWHPVPSFHLLYRAFEDRHRGTPELITERQRADYLADLLALPNPELPIADLGCGRGELVHLLDAEGAAVIGVDSNHGQISDGEERLFVEADLFTWLDAAEDASLRAVVAVHVVEHLPTDLQVRLVFEARRVLAPGGLLVLETPNLYSLVTAAANFWVDPTHERPVHPLFMEFLASEAGFAPTELRQLHQIDVHFRDPGVAPGLVEDLESLILGAGDIALLAHR